MSRSYHHRPGGDGLVSGAKNNMPGGEGAGQGDGTSMLLVAARNTYMIIIYYHSDDDDDDDGPNNIWRCLCMIR